MILRSCLPLDCLHVRREETDLVEHGSTISRVAGAQADRSGAVDVKAAVAIVEQSEGSPVFTCEPCGPADV